MKPLLHAAAATVVLAGAAVALASPPPPFPPPKLTGVTPATKCDWGPISEIKSSRIIVRTDAGAFTVEVSSKAKIAGLDGKPLGSTSALSLGQKVRVYYLVDDGAQAQEIDVIP